MRQESERDKMINSASGLVEVMTKSKFSQRFLDKEDFAQECMAKIVRRFDSYDKNKSSFRTWACRQASGEILDQCRRVLGRSKLYDTPQFVAMNETVTSKTVATLDPDSPMETKEQVDWILSPLNTQEREVVQRRVIDGEKFSSIAKCIGMRKQTIHDTYYSAIEKIRQHVQSSV